MVVEDRRGEKEPTHHLVYFGANQSNDEKRKKKKNLPSLEKGEQELLPLSLYKI